MVIFIIVVLIIIIVLAITLNSKSSKKDSKSSKKDTGVNELDIELLKFLKLLLDYGSKDSPLFLKENYNGLEEGINIIKETSGYPNDPSLAASTKELLKYFDKYMPYLKDLSDLGSETVLLHDHLLNTIEIFKDKDFDWSIKNAKPIGEQICDDFKNQAEIKTNLQDLVHNTVDMLKQEGDEYGLAPVFREQSVGLAKIHDGLEDGFSKITGRFVYEISSRYDYKEWSKKIKGFESDSIREYADSLQKDGSNNKTQSSAHKKNEKKSKATSSNVTKKNKN